MEKYKASRIIFKFGGDVMENVSFSVNTDVSLIFVYHETGAWLRFPSYTVETIEFADNQQYEEFMNKYGGLRK